MNMVALIWGLRVSEIPKVVLVEEHPVKLVLVNWKMSNSRLKKLNKITPVELTNMGRCRQVTCVQKNAPDDPDMWIRALWMTNPHPNKPGFLFQVDKKFSMSLPTVKNTLKLIPVEETTSDHRFRVSNASLARAANIPDQIIMKQVD